MTLASTQSDALVCSIPDPLSDGWPPRAVSATSGKATPDTEIIGLRADLAAETEARRAAEAALEAKEMSLQSSNRALEKVARSLDEQRLQLNSILDHTAAGIFLANPAQSIICANNAGRLMFGIADDDAIFGMSVPDLFADPEATSDALAQAMEGGGGDAREAEGKRVDGGVFPVEFAANTISRPGSTPDDRRQSVWIVRDITERKAREAHNASLERELSAAQKLEALGTLASGIAHEINTPVQYVGDNLSFMAGAIGGLCELIAGYHDGETPDIIASIRARIDVDFLLRELPQSIAQSRHGLSEVARIVGAIREYSHPGSGPTTTILVNDAVTNALALSRNVWKNAAEIVFDADGTHPVVEGNTGDLSQVVVNMVVNSAFAITKRQMKDKGSIRIATRVCGEEVEIEVSDNGGGIEEGAVEKIFDPFFTTKDIGEGSGQGLAISRNIIRNNHNGRIVCCNRPGDGVSFTIILPLADIPQAKAV